LNYLQALALSNTMANMKLKGEASKLALSYLWWVIEPMLYVAVFYLVFEKLLARGGDQFLTFLMVGQIPFLWLSKSINASANALVGAKGIIGQRDIPKFIFPYAVIQENFKKQIVVFLILLIFLVIQGQIPTRKLLGFLLVAAVNYLAIVPMCLLAALAVVYLADIRMLINFFTLFLMFASGIFWDIHSIPDTDTQNLLLTANPFAFLLDAYRAILLRGESPDWLHLGIIAIGSLALLVLTHGLYKAQNNVIARRVLS